MPSWNSSTASSRSFRSWVSTLPSSSRRSRRQTTCGTRIGGSLKNVGSYPRSPALVTEPTWTPSNVKRSRQPQHSDCSHIARYLPPSSHCTESLGLPITLDEVRLCCNNVTTLQWRSVFTMKLLAVRLFIPVRLLSLSLSLSSPCLPPSLALLRFFCMFFIIFETLFLLKMAFVCFDSSRSRSE